jgi:hypothetical protein
MTFEEGEVKQLKEILARVNGGVATREDQDFQTKLKDSLIEQLLEENKRLHAEKLGLLDPSAIVTLQEENEKLLSLLTQTQKRIELLEQTQLKKRLSTQFHRWIESIDKWLNAEKIRVRELETRVEELAKERNELKVKAEVESKTAETLKMTYLQTKNAEDIRQSLAQLNLRK